MSVSPSIGCPLCFILYLFCSSFCLKCTTMAMTTTPLVTAVSFGMSSLSLVTMAPSLMGLPATLDQCDVVLPLPLTLGCPGGLIGLASVLQQQPPSLMPLQAYANYAMGSSWVGFFFRVEPSTNFYIICLVPFQCLLSTPRYHAGCHINPWGLNCWGLHHCNPLEFTHGRYMSNLLMVIGPHQVCTEWLLPLLC